VLANNKKFDAIRQGDMVVEVPNGIDARSCSSPKSYTHLKLGIPLFQLGIG